MRAAAALSSAAGRVFRPRVFGWDAGRVLPPALLVLALAALFVFGGDRSYFNRSSVHKWNSVKNLALAENLSPSDDFRLFTAKRRDLADGSTRYDLYGRFPIGGTALIKLAIAPFNSLSAKLQAARTLALTMFCGAAVFAYLAISRLTSSRWIGLAATLIAFSSYYALYNGDEVSNETAMDIFGVMLTFHGMAIFVQDGRFRQLPIKACAALLVGWHVYALVLAFIAFGRAGEVAALIRSRQSASAGVPPALGMMDVFASLIRSRYVILGATTLAFGIVMLGANLANEYYAHAGDAPPPSLNSALRRLNLAENAWLDSPDWPLFAAQQLFRAGGAALPYALPWKYGYPEPPSPPLAGVAVGVLAAGGALVLAASARRHRALWAALALFGFVWALLIRDNAANAWHDFEALFYIGIPLALFGLALTRARGLWGEGAVVMAAVAAVAVFIISAFQIQTGEMSADAQSAETQKAEMADFDVIRQWTRGEVVAVHPQTFGRLDNAADWYLAGALFPRGELTLGKMSRADFIISRYREYGGLDLLTPENREIFLHAAPRDPTELYRAERERVQSQPPAARAVFDLYMDGDALVYIKEPCDESDTRDEFFVNVYPVRPESLPRDRRAWGYESLTFRFANRGTPIFNGACMARERLPGYPIKTIVTGKRIPDELPTWSAAINPPLSAESIARYESIYQDAKASGEPLIRSDFDVYMQDNALIYLKEPCAESDTVGRFFLSVRPADAADLPEHRREFGHDSRNFDFSPRGVVFAGKCMMRRELPDYDIAEISTGQDVPGEGRAWSAMRLPISAESIARYESAYQDAIESGELLIDAAFDVYLQDGALAYLKEPCAPDDARGRFFLSVHPVNAADLPQDRRELGHDSLNFDFSQHGIIFGGKCMIRRELPDYDIARIATGQDAPGVGRLWSGNAALRD